MRIGPFISSPAFFSPAFFSAPVIFYLISTHILAVAYYLQHVRKL